MRLLRRIRYLVFQYRGHCSLLLFWPLPCSRYSLSPTPKLVFRGPIQPITTHYPEVSHIYRDSHLVQNALCCAGSNLSVSTLPRLVLPLEITTNKLCGQSKNSLKVYANFGLANASPLLSRYVLTLQLSRERRSDGSRISGLKWYVGNTLSSLQWPHPGVIRQKSTARGKSIGQSTALLQKYHKT